MARRRGNTSSDSDSGDDEGRGECFTDTLSVPDFAATFVSLLLGAHGGVATTGQIERLLKFATPRGDGAIDTPRSVALLNEALAHVDLSLSSLAHPKTGEKTFALVNTHSDDAAQLATTFSANEIAFVKRIIYKIMTTEDDVFSISTGDALRESSVAKVSVTETENLLDRIVDMGWLDITNGWISLSMRALMELKTYLREEFEDYVQYCSVCKEMVTTHYERCSDGACPGRLHKFCAGRYFGVNARKCPHEGCGANWEGITPAPNSQNRGSGSRVVNKKRRKVDQGFFDKRKKRASGAGSGSEEEEEGDLEGFVVGDDDDEEEEATQQPREQEEEEEEEEEEEVPLVHKGKKRQQQRIEDSDED
ncbi:hypothetical protein HDU98_011688 [Podochytrium sp. JEL0797]|nr:hypothetical protein HDU98_011688 [Podochytrium sp. JEL0797]